MRSGAIGFRLRTEKPSQPTLSPNARGKALLGKNLVESRENVVVFSEKCHFFTTSESGMGSRRHQRVDPRMGRRRLDTGQEGIDLREREIEGFPEFFPLIVG